MKKAIFLLMVACSVFLQAVAQRQNNYYFKNNGRSVNSIDSADYIRVVQEPERGSTLYPTKEYYPNESKKSVGYSSRINPPKYEGQYRSFYLNGKTKQVLTYAAGRIIDTAYTYFPNGKLYSEVVYTQAKDARRTYLKTVRDSTGKSLVSNGNGLAVLYDEDFEYVKEKGTVKNGNADGDWTGVLIVNDTLSYKESYADGKLLAGESTDGKGNIYHYTVSEQVPTFKGGMTAFYKYISRTVRYPQDLARARVQGIAQIRFVVKSNGELTDLHDTNNVHPELAAEAIRVIKNSKGWEPGIQKGRKVNVSYNIPVSFSLN